MKVLLNREMSTKPAWIKKVAFLLVVVLAAGLVLQPPTLAKAAGDDKCEKLCQAALKKTGNSSKLKYQSNDASKFGGFSVSDSEKVSSIMYMCDDKEVYSICVVRAATKSDASDLKKAMKAYISSNKKSDYLNDYTSDERKVLKNAVYGQKGKYVWYIAMSASKSVNKKGQKEIKKKI